MADEFAPPRDDDNDHVYVPEEFFEHLPPELQIEFTATKHKAQAVLEVVDKDIKNLIRLGNAFPTMVSLRHIQRRLAELKFEMTPECILDHDMLTCVFAVTYARLINGGLGAGVSRSSLPEHLRITHDYLIEVRNKRFAHNVGHESISTGIVIDFDKTQFDVKLNFQMGFHVGGANEWEELVVFLDGLMYDRLYAQLAKLKEKTGYEWTFPAGPRQFRSDASVPATAGTDGAEK